MISLPPPVKQPPYHTPMIHREKIAEMVDEMRERRIVQSVTSLWANPVVLVPKKDRTLQFCIDFRKLNQSPERMSTPFLESMIS